MVINVYIYSYLAHCIYQTDLNIMVKVKVMIKEQEVYRTLKGVRIFELSANNKLQ